MDKKLIESVELTPLKQFEVEGGNVFHALKESDSSYLGFGEAYFSFIESNSIKAWKRHKKMTLNLVVPIGEVKFVVFDDQNIEFRLEILSQENYNRLTVPPGLWLGFMGLSKEKSMLLNVADLEHDPNEVDRLTLEEIEFNWRR